MTDLTPGFVLEGDDLELLRTLSRHVYLARLQGLGVASNGMLLEQEKKTPKSVCAPYLPLWAGDSYRMSGFFEEAVTQYERVVTDYEPETVIPIGLHDHALAAGASCLAALDRADDAVSSLRELAARDSDHFTPAEALHHAGRTYEEAGRLDEARELYLEAQSTPEKRSSSCHSRRELAGRDAARIQQGPAPYGNSAEQLALKLARALRKRDEGTLRELASKTHFSVAVGGGHREWVEGEEILEELLAELAESAVRVEPAALHGSGAKRYLHTRGWRGERLGEWIVLLLVDSPFGWQWEGVVLLLPPRKWIGRMEPSVKETNQPLDISIKAPWPAGLSFTAGGLRTFAAEMGEMIAAQRIPWVGWVLALLLLLRNANRPCGFGLGGFYYNFGPTHMGQEAFAIDFTQYRTGHAFISSAGGIPTLSVKDGIVLEVVDWNTTGSDADDNRVRVWLGDLIPGSVPRQMWMTHYWTRHRHMGGPSMIPVSRGMMIEQGTRLGPIDDTGNSVLDHVHFSIHDINLGEQSVRPTPMDGQRLEDRDEGRCILSSNVPVP